MTKSLELLKSRRSAKRFQSGFKLTKEQITELLESIRFAPSSFGMEPFRVIYLENKEIREKLLEPWWNQVGVTQSSGILIWIGYKEEYIKSTLIEDQNNRNIPESFTDIKDMMKQGLNGVWQIHNMSIDEWVSRQAYISLGTVLNTAEEMGIDLCPSEGFDPNTVGKILEENNLIDLKNEKVLVGSFVGKVDTAQEFHHFFTKTRKPEEKTYTIVE